SNGLTLLGTYTYSKATDYAIGTFAGEGLAGAGFQNWNNLRADRSVSTLDQTHRFIFNTVYELPFYRSAHGLAGKMLGGWQISGIYLAYSGNPLGAASATNNTFSQGG